MDSYGELNIKHKTSHMSQMMSLRNFPKMSTVNHFMNHIYKAKK